MVRDGTREGEIAQVFGQHKTFSSTQLVLRLTSFATPSRRQKVRARRRLDGRIDLPNNRQAIVSLPRDQSVFHGEGQQHDRPEAGSRGGGHVGGSFFFLGHFKPESIAFSTALLHYHTSGRFMNRTCAVFVLFRWRLLIVAAERKGHSIGIIGMRNFPAGLTQQMKSRKKNISFCWENPENTSPRERGGRTDGPSSNRMNLGIWLGIWARAEEEVDVSIAGEPNKDYVPIHVCCAGTA